MIELTLIRDIVAILGVLAAFTYYAITVRHHDRQRNTQLFMDYHAKINSEPLRSKQIEVMRWEWEDIDDFEAKYGKLSNADGLFKNPDSKIMTLLDVMNYYEGLGVLISKNNLDLEMVSRFGGYLPYLWEKYEEVFYSWRKRADWMSLFVEFEDLYLRIREHWKSTSVVTNMVATFKSRRKTLGLPVY